MGEGGQPGGFSRGDRLFGRPDVVRAGFGREISPVGGLRSFDGFEVAKLGLCCHSVGVGGLELLGPTGCFCELLSEAGKECGAPSLRLRGGGWGRVVRSIVIASTARAEKNHWSS